MKMHKFILAVAIILFMLSCRDDDDHYIYWDINSAYTGYYIMALNTTDTGAQCDPGEIPPTPTRIEFGDITVDWNYDLFFYELGLLNDETVLIDFWGDLWDDRMELVMRMETRSPSMSWISREGIRFGAHFGGIRWAIAL